MAGTKPKIRFSKVIEILLWLAGLGVLAENIVLLQQNRRLNETLAPQISVGAQLQMLAGIAFAIRTRFEQAWAHRKPEILRSGSRLLHLRFFRPMSAPDGVCKVLVLHAQRLNGLGAS